MSRYENSDIGELLLKLGIIAIFGGGVGLISLGNVILVDCWIILQVLPFFKYDLAILGLKMLFGL
jgi:hypothetical protein